MAGLVIGQFSAKGNNSVIALNPPELTDLLCAINLTKT